MSGDYDPNRGAPDRTSENEQDPVSGSSVDTNEEPDQISSSYEYVGNNAINADPQYNIEDKNREDIYYILDYIFNNGHNDSTEDKRFLENQFMIFYM